MMPHGVDSQATAILTAVLMNRQERDMTAREAAQRILSLQGDGEGDADFARRIGATAQDLVNWKKGKGVSIDKAAVVHRETGVSLHWLLTGDEPDDAYADGFRAALELVLKSEREISRLLGTKPGVASAARGARGVKRAARGEDRPPVRPARGGRNP